MKLKKYNYSIPSLILASLAGGIFVFVIYVVLIEGDMSRVIMFLAPLALSIISIVLHLQKMHKDSKNFERQMQIQQRNLDIQKEQLHVLKDIRAKRTKKLPKYESEWDPWPVIFILILIVIFIPLIFYVIYSILKED